MTPLEKFLSTHKANKTDKPSTHTRIGCDNPLIYGGNYHIPTEDLPEFYDLYYDAVFVKQQTEYLTEKQTNDVMAIDLDIHYSYETTTRQYTKDNIDDLVDYYANTLKRYMQIDDSPIDIFIMQKDSINRVKDKNITKDGIHIIFKLAVPRPIQAKIRADVMAAFPEMWSNVPYINDIEDIFDDSITKGSTNWQLFGSQKPLHQPYKLTQYWTAKIDKTDGELCIDKCPIEITRDLFEKMSVQRCNYAPAPTQLGANELGGAPRESNGTFGFVESKQGNNRFQLLTTIIREIRKLESFSSFGDKYPEWSKIGWTFYNECNGSRDGLLAFDSLSREFKNYDGIDAVDKVYHCANRDNKKKLGLKWLIDLLKTNGADETVFETIASMQSNGKARFAANDDQASDLLYKEVKDIFKSCKSRLFYLDGNVWTSDNNKIDDIMLRRILQSGIYSGLNEKTGKPVSYAQNVSKATKIRDALYVKIRVQNDDPELYTKFYQNTKGLLCFKNGVINLKTKMFTLWKDVPKHTVFTTLVIDYDYDPSPNEAAIREIKAAIFEPLFGDKMDTALHFLARAMAGHNEDKRFATYLGNRNCGKGVLYALLKNAFGDYVATFELGNIMYCRKTAGMENVDTSKKMYWALDLEGRRLVISQEVPDIKSGMMINGKMLKKITGGGDDILARRNYDRCDTLVRLVVSLFMLGNTDLVYDAEDCLEEAVEFTSVVQFKTQAEIDAMREEGRSELEMRRYRIADPDIKHKCETNDEWKRAMVALILRSYKTEKVPIIRDVSTEQNGLLSRIESIFDLTYNKNDIIPVKDIYSSLPDFDKKKIKTELNAMNIFDKKIKDSSIYRDKICFVGIKYKPIKTVPIATAVNECPQDDEVEIIEC